MGNWVSLLRMWYFLLACLTLLAMDCRHLLAAATKKNPLTIFYVVLFVTFGRINWFSQFLGTSYLILCFLDVRALFLNQQLVGTASGSWSTRTYVLSINHSREFLQSQLIHCDNQLANSNKFVEKTFLWSFVPSAWAIGRGSLDNSKSIPMH